ncbi:MAG TPA: hypothetical protein VE993_19515, partial [Stellaceae bacterium]|nr:hypothetical protein [Stellaceae bacterium]
MVALFKRPPTPSSNLEARIALLSARRAQNGAEVAPEPAAAPEPANAAAAPEPPVATDGAAVTAAPDSVALPAAEPPVLPMAESVSSPPEAEEADESEALAALCEQIATQIGLEISPEMRKS